MGIVVTFAILDLTKSRHHEARTRPYEVLGKNTGILIKEMIMTPAKFSKLLKQMKHLTDKQFQELQKRLSQDIVEGKKNTCRAVC